VPNRVHVIGIGCHDKLLKLISELPCLALEIALSSADKLLIGVGNILVIVTLITVDTDHNSLGSLLRPPLITFGAPLHTLVGCLGGAPQPLSVAYFPLFRTKMAPTASSLEACLVEISRSSFIIFG
jgi:hypothetical protein